MYSGKSVIYKMEVRRKEAEGFINIRKCQDTRQRLVYITIVFNPFSCTSVR